MKRKLYRDESIAFFQRFEVVDEQMLSIDEFDSTLE